MLPANYNPPAFITWSCGGQMDGEYWRRKNDILGIAVGQIFESAQWIKAAGGRYGSSEGHIETYYNFAITKYMRIGPDLQIIWNPHGVGRDSQGDTGPIFVYGGRINVVY